jgi:acetylornithine deacetylase/succinyl-diaminopimelate desuccinylase family protein
MSAATEDQLAARIASYRDEIVDFIQALVAIPTQNPPGAAYRACVEAIAQHLRTIGVDYTVVDVPPDNAAGTSLSTRMEAEDPYPSACLLGSYGAGSRVLYFHGHYDVVPATDAQFRPSVQGDKVFGRGSADMKGGLAVILYAVKAIKECGLALDGRIGLTIVPDEETGGRRGAQYLAAAGLLGADGIGMLTPEPTGGVIWNANRGAITLRITVKGVHAHVGLQHQGVNAFDRMLTVAQAMQEIKSEVEQRRTGFAIAPEAARHSILMLGGECAGGTSFNAVPAACMFTVDRRMNPEEDLQAEKARLLETLERLQRSGINLEVEVLQEAEASGSSEHSALARALARNATACTGAAPAFELCPGLLEIRFYGRRGIPAYAYGPGLLDVAHGPDEWVSISRVLTCATIYARTAVDLLHA